jgi:hypothetical protein
MGVATGERALLDSIRTPEAESARALLPLIRGFWPFLTQYG